jgi:hypothetical protein
VERLVAGFSAYVDVFEASGAFVGPSVYFHERAIERRRMHDSVQSMLADRLFLEYVYAVLPAWGMHRMGSMSAKVDDFEAIASRLSMLADPLESLWHRRITHLPGDDALTTANTAWEVIEALRVSTSSSQIVAGSKFLHHLLPDLLPPIDRRYTMAFFTGQTQVCDQRRAFLTWLPRFAEIGRRCQGPIQQVLNHEGPMATSEAKMIDNAIVGFMVRQRGEEGLQPSHVG